VGVIGFLLVIYLSKQSTKEALTLDNASIPSTPQKGGEKQQSSLLESPKGVDIPAHDDQILTVQSPLESRSKVTLSFQTPEQKKASLKELGSVATPGGVRRSARIARKRN